jgi:hypothetical protein
MRKGKANRTRGALFGGFHGRRHKPGLMDPALQGLPHEDAVRIAREKQAAKQVTVEKRNRWR